MNPKLKTMLNLFLLFLLFSTFCSLGYFVGNQIFHTEIQLTKVSYDEISDVLAIDLWINFTDCQDEECRIYFFVEYLIINETLIVKSHPDATIFSVTLILFKENYFMKLSGDYLAACPSEYDLKYLGLHSSYTFTGINSDCFSTWLTFWKFEK